MNIRLYYCALHRYKADITTTPHRNSVGFFLQDITDTSIMLKFLPGALQKQAKWHQARQLKSLIQALRRQTQVGLCSLRPPWSAKGVPGQPGYIRRPCLKTNKNTNANIPSHSYLGNLVESRNFLSLFNFGLNAIPPLVTCNQSQTVTSPNIFPSHKMSSSSDSTNLVLPLH